MRSFFSRLYHLTTPRRAALTLVVLVVLLVLAWGSLAFHSKAYYEAGSSLIGATEDGSSRGYVEQILREYPGLVSYTDKDGQTPLHTAVRWKDNKDVVELLLANKAKINAKDNIGATPLFYAAAAGHMDVATLLREHGGH